MQTHKRINNKVISLAYFAWLDKVRPSPFVQDLILTTLVSILSTICAIITVRVIAGNLGPEQFGAFSLANRIMIFAAPIMTLGMELALPYYLATAKTEAGRNEYLCVSILLVSLSLILMLTIGYLFRHWFTRIIFHASFYEPLFLALLTTVWGYTAYILLYAYYRGKLLMRIANLWHLFAIDIGPLIVALGLSWLGRADLLLFCSGLLMIGAVIPLARHTQLAMSQISHWDYLHIPLKKMLTYGLPRILGSFFLAALLGFGPFWVSNISSLKEAGYLSASQSLLMALQGGLSAFGLVALPKVAYIAELGNHEKIAKLIEHILSLVIHVGLFMTLSGLLWTREIVVLILGNQYEPAIPLMKTILLALVPYLSYVMLRSIVDAVEIRSVNTRHLFFALISTVLLGILTTAIHFGVVGVAASVTFGFSVLGVMTIYYLMRAYPFDWRNLRLNKVIVLNMSLFTIVWFLKSFILRNESGLYWVSWMIMLNAMSSLLYILVLWRMKINWILELANRMLPSVNI